MELLFTDGTEVHQELHAEATCKKRFVGRFAHFEEELDTAVFPLPGKDVGVALDHDDVDQVEPLLIVLRIVTRLQLEQVVRYGHSVPRVNLRRALQLLPRQNLITSKTDHHY